MPSVCQNTIVAPSPDALSIAVVNAVGLDGDALALCLLEQSDDCIKLLSVDGTLEFMNCNGMAVMEIDQPQTVLQKLWWDLWPVESQSFVKEKFSTAAQGRTVVFDAMCPTAKGNERYWSVNLKPLFANNGPVVSVLVTSRAIAFPDET